MKYKRNAILNRSFSCANLQHTTLGLGCLICINALYYLPIAMLIFKKPTKYNTSTLKYIYETFNIITHLIPYLSSKKPKSINMQHLHFKYASNIQHLYTFDLFHLQRTENHKNKVLVHQRLNIGTHLTLYTFKFQKSQKQSSWASKYASNI